MRLLHGLLAFMAYDMLRSSAIIAGMAARMNDPKVHILGLICTVMFIFVCAHMTTITLFGRDRRSI